MSYFKDLSNYSYLHYENSKNIGWLDKEYSYSKGKVCEEFIDSLWKYLHLKLMEARGYHSCNLCSVLDKGIFIATNKDESIKLGFSEIRVLSEDGTCVYAAPNLIYHYILNHEYKPPEEFIQAVLYGSKPGESKYEKFLASFRDYTLYGRNMNDIKITLWGESVNNINRIIEFHNAIKEGNLERVIKLFDLSAEWTDSIIPFSNWLYIASSEGQYEIVKYMISRGVQMNVSQLATNPLFGAINGGYIDIVKLLIESGIDSNVKYDNEFIKNMDALTFANKKGKTEIINLLQSNVLPMSINDKKYNGNLSSLCNN